MGTADDITANGNKYVKKLRRELDGLAKEGNEYARRTIL